MKNSNDNLEKFITDLLHIDEVSRNKLIDLYAGDKSKTFFLINALHPNLSKYTLDLINSKRGKIGNTVLRKSALLDGEEQRLGIDAIYDWADGKTQRDAKKLNDFADFARKELLLKGINPLFLSVGAIRWKISNKREIKEVTTPLLLFPIRINRADNGGLSPLYIEFVDDDAFINPCLIAKLRQAYGDTFADNFPCPDGLKADEPINLDGLGDGEKYFNIIQNYTENELKQSGGKTLFEFRKDIVAVFTYNHDELCMYYDVRKNKEKIYSSELIRRMFNLGEKGKDIIAMAQPTPTILPKDSTQERIINRVSSGESLIIKGPPGTGKTLTITNMIAGLLAENKKVMFASQKKAALTAVYEQLPPSLRKFVMMLECETEAQAVKLNPTEIKKDFKSLIEYCKKYTPNDSAYDDLEKYGREFSSAVGFLSGYYKIFFTEKSVIGRTLYQAIDLCLKTEAEPILFFNAKDVDTLSRAEYDESYSAVSDASIYYKKLIDGMQLKLNPWIKETDGEYIKNVEDAFSLNGEITKLVKKYIAETEKNFDGENVDGLKLFTVNTLCKEKITDDEIKLVTDIKNKNSVDFICSSLTKYLGSETNLSIKVNNKESAKKLLKELNTSVAMEENLSALKMIKNLSVTDFIGFCESFDIICKINDAAVLTKLTDDVKEFFNIIRNRAEKEEKVYAVFNRNLTDEQKAEILKAENMSQGVLSSKKTKPSLFDFALKKYYAKAKTYGYGKDITFENVIKATVGYGEIESINADLKRLQSKLCSYLGCELDLDTVKLLVDLIKICSDKNVSVADFNRGFSIVKDAIKNMILGCSINGNARVKDIIFSYNTASEYINIIKEVEKIFVGEHEEEKLFSLAKKILAIKDVEDNNLNRLYKKCVTNSENLILCYGGIVEKLKDFRKRFFSNYYTQNIYDLKVGEIKTFIKYSTDRTSLGNAEGYYSVLYKKEYALPIDKFFNEIISNGIKVDEISLEDLFEHSVYSIAVNFRLNLLGEYRNGIGDKISREIDEFSNGEKEIAKANLSIIESRCISRINPKDVSFSFLDGERSNGETVRKLFKKHAEAILKLKRCFIISPSTASVLFTREEFCEFDTVIIDEASQLEPTSVIPLLYRAKQVVFVGDEWQMPPISHFEIKSEKVMDDGDGDYEILSPNLSALSFAIKNNAFPVEQFVCHYRSKTESLISFSQKEFYPYMKTFPSPTPKLDGLGFKDVYADDGYCQDGVNNAEAEKIVEQIKEHFDKYYNDKTGELKSSVGVVAFGKKQTDHIRNLIRKDAKLENKINKALSNFNDLPEKLFFVKSIETVQGQETDSLILSLTYGRNKNGEISQSFAELNRGAESDLLGKCIFNVAVTRAKRSVTVIHSVHAEDITKPSVRYLGEYLKTVKRFAEEGRSQFVGKKLNECGGFIKSVAKFLGSLGIDEERIIADFGATDGSIRIPLVILNDDCKTALIGIWCETERAKDEDRFDYEIKYVESLKARGWNIVRIFAEDWFDNAETEKQRLKKILTKYL